MDTSNGYSIGTGLKKAFATLLQTYAAATVATLSATAATSLDSWATHLTGWPQVAIPFALALTRFAVNWFKINRSAR